MTCQRKQRASNSIVTVVTRHTIGKARVTVTLTVYPGPERHITSHRTVQERPPLDWSSDGTAHITVITKPSYL